MSEPQLNTRSEAELEAAVAKMAVEAKAAQGVGQQLREMADELSKREFDWIATQLLVTANAIENGADVAEVDDLDDGEED
jgi:hypothetical protein